MSGYQLEKDEVVLFDKQIIVEEFKSEVKLTLTSKKMIFEKEKGIFKKKLKVIDIISIANIKVYKETAQVEQKKANVIIQTIDKNVTLSCSNVSEAKKIADEIINLRTGSNKLKRNSSKLKKVANDVVSVAKDVGEVAAAVAVVAVPVYKWFKNRNH